MSKARQSHPASIRSLAATYSPGHIIPPHSHDWHQLLYASHGVMTIHTSHGSWVVPPHRAAWIPANVQHSVEMSGSVSMRTIYLAPRLSKFLPTDCCTVNVPPLLRELILEAVHRDTLSRSIPAEARLIALMLDQIQALPAAPLQLPMPRDPRASRVAALLKEDPAESRSLLEIARKAGASARTIERLFRSETGMAFSKWRQRLRLLHALRLLASGEQVINVALESGYASASAFVAMFRRELGTTPSRYHSGASNSSEDRPAKRSTTWR